MWLIILGFVTVVSGAFCLWDALCDRYGLDDPFVDPYGEDV